MVRHALPPAIAFIVNVEICHRMLSNADERGDKRIDKRRRSSLVLVADDGSSFHEKRGATKDLESEVEMNPIPKLPPQPP